jgi:hypothetical protein
MVSIGVASKAGRFAMMESWRNRPEAMDMDEG